MRTKIVMLIFIFGCINVWTQIHETNDPELVYVGALETKRSTWPNQTYEATKDTTTKKIVRVLFYKDGKEWLSLQNKISDTNVYPSGREWYIAFDGKQIGKLNSKKEQLMWPKSPWTYPRDAYHSTFESDLPTVGSPTPDFASWVNEKEFRPLIVVTQPNCIDPDKWKPFKPDYADLDKFFPIYKSYLISLFPSMKNIDESEVKYSKSYQSNKSDQLIQLGIKRSIHSENISYPIWIYLSKTGEIINLSKRIDYSFSQDEFSDDDFSVNTVVDAGDYDSNGNSELIFWSSRYDGNGYVMFYNDFINMVEFTWSYH